MPQDSGNQTFDPVVSLHPGGRPAIFAREVFFEQIVLGDGFGLGNRRIERGLPVMRKFPKRKRVIVTGDPNGARRTTPRIGDWLSTKRSAP